MSDHIRDAYAVLLPAFAGLALDNHLQEFLRNGGRSLLLGETREEYVARAMSAERRAAETAAHVRSFVDAASALADGPLIIAVDQEPAGICRLHDLVAPLPDLATLHKLSSTEIEAKAAGVARAARRMGVTLFLAPIVDVVHGENPWLARRTLGTDAAEVSRIASAFVRGVQSAGVTAMAKHFPGHSEAMSDPAMSDARQSASCLSVSGARLSFACR